MKKTIFLAALFLLSLALVAPYIASSPFGKPLILFFLHKDLPGALDAQRIYLSWLGPQRFEQVTFTSDDFVIKCEKITSHIPLWSGKNWAHHLQIENGTFSSLHYPEGELIEIQATIQGQQLDLTAMTRQRGSLSIQGTLPLDQHPFDLTAHLHNMPTIVIDNLFHCNTWLNKILGPLCNIEASYTFQDEEESFSMDLVSTYAKSVLRAQIQDNVATLTAPWTFTVAISDPLRHALLSHVQSQWIADFQTKNPIHLEISPQGFRCPLFPFDLQKLHIEQSSLQLGKILLQSDPSTRFLMKLLKGKGVTNPILCWFAPVSLQIEKGILSLGRLDALLSQSIHLCAWGDVSLLTQKLRMVLGIPVTTLQNIINVSTFPPHYVFKIPITGTISHPKFETGPTFGKIAAVAASKQLPSAPGKVFGGIVNAVAGSQDQTDVPPPNRPFPWEK